MMDHGVAGLLEDLRREREKVIGEARRLEAEIYAGPISSEVLDDYIEDLRALRMKFHHLDIQIEAASSQGANSP